MGTQVIAYSGQTAPGSDGAVFSASSGPSAVGISDDGSVLFRAYLEGPGVQSGINDEGLWMSAFGETSKIVRLGDPVVDMPGFAFDEIRDAYIDPFGNIGFVARVTDGLDVEVPFFVEENGVIVRKIGAGSFVEDGNALIGDPNVIAFNNGRVLLTGGLTRPPATAANDVAMMIYDPSVDPSTLQFVAREGDPMVGAAGFVFDFKANNLTNPLDPKGRAIIQMSGLNPTTREEIAAVYRWTNDALEPIEISAPGQAQTVYVESRLNTNGEAAFNGFKSYPTTRAIWHEGGRDTPLASEGDPANGVSSAFAGFIEFALTDDNRIIAHAGLDDDSKGIWKEDGTGTLNKLVAVGDTAPGVEPDMTFYRVNTLVTNRSGEISFSDLAVSSSTSGEISGLWTGDENGLSLVIKRGDPVTVAEADTRIVEDPDVGAGSRTGADGHPSTMNSDGDILFTVEFTTGHGNAVLVASSGLVVNSVGDRPDADDSNGDGVIALGEESDGVCDTGETVIRDDGSEEAECTYRAAITEANATPGHDKIRFDIPGPAPYVIEPETELPSFTEAVSVRGPAVSGVIGKGELQDGWKVWLSGRRSSGAVTGQVIASDDVELRNLVIVNWPADGILLRDAANTVVASCLIGTDFLGAEGYGNGGFGIRSEGKAFEVRIGGNSPGEGNVISGNMSGGIRLSGDILGATISGNIVGLKPDGSGPLSNLGPGITIEGGLAGTIGGRAKTTGRAPGNIVSGNTGSGIILDRTEGTKIIGNLVGTNGAGDTVGPRVDEVRHRFSNGVIGIEISGSLNTIGQGGFARNVIAGHLRNVSIDSGSANVVYGNLIGLDVTGKQYLESGTGIYVVLSSKNKLGGAEESERNHIAFGDSTGNAIRLEVADENVIRNNYIGLGVDGGCPLGAPQDCELGSDGISLYTTNLTTVDGNVIGHSGGSGISLQYSDSTTVTLNKIGIDPTGTSPVANAGDGIRLIGSAHNMIGGQNAGNVISANKEAGIRITGARSIFNHIADNLVGVGADGSCQGGDPCPLGNGGAGIVLDDSVSSTDIAFNQISGNGLDGIRMRASSFNSIENNGIGTNADGTAKIPNQASGIRIEDATDNAVGVPSTSPSNLISGNKRNGVLIRGEESTRNVVINNLIGTDVTGEKRLGNGKGGVLISNAPANQVGGTVPSYGNVISANGYGVAVDKEAAVDNVIEGNFIGTNISGNAGLGNVQWGIVVQSAPATVIGGSTRASRNVIADNGAAGILLNQAGTKETEIYGNFVGLSAGGATLGNKENGIEVRYGAESNRIGGSGEGEGNVISANEAAGVLISGPETMRNQITGNFIGLDSTGTLDYGNHRSGIQIENAARTIVRAGNVISGNDEEGILVNGGGTEITLIEGNLIGTDVTGTRKVANSRTGISIVGGRSIFVGNPDIGASGNLISGNREHGILIGGARTVFVRNNLIGTDSAGTEALGNGKDGVRVVSSRGVEIGGDNPNQNACAGPCNVISGNREHGVTVSGERSFDVELAGNYVGLDRSGLKNLANVGRGVNVIGGSHGVIGGPAFRKNVVANHVGSVSEQRNAGVALVGVEHWTVTNNEIRNNNAGVLLLNATSNTVASNRITQNECGIDQIGTRADVNLLEVNFVANNSGDCTGIRLESGRSLISGNTITGDAGNGISVEGDAQPTILDNNIMGNGGFGVVTADEAFPITATSNWWGDPSGPGGAGPGSGQSVGPGIDFSDWRTALVALVGAPAADTVLARPGASDSTLVLFRNWAEPEDVIDATFSDDQGWLLQPLSATVSLSDLDGGEALVGFSVPGGSAGTLDKVLVTAGSRTDPRVSSVDSFYIAVYEPALTAIVLQPDSVVALPGDTIRFAAVGLDQLGQTIEFDPVWSATGGSISDSGEYVAGDTGGLYSVTASDESGAIAGRASIHVPTSVGVEEDPGGPRGETEVPRTYALYQSYPNPFNPTATIEYDVKEEVLVDLRVYDVTGREIATLVRSHRTPGHYSTVFRASSLPSGLYIYRIVMGDFSRSRKMILLK